MRRLLTLALLAVVLAACAPVRLVVVDGLNTIGQSENVLAYAAGGIQIDPGPIPLMRVILDVQGANLVTTDEACEGTTERIVCDWIVLAEPHLVSLSGQDVTATATYRRPGDSFFSHEILSD